LEDQLDLIVEEPESWRGGVSWPVIVSMIVHVFLIAWLVKSYRPVQQGDAAPPIARYVQLIRQNPQDFTEAPGAKVKAAPLNAPLSDANRKAATPQPTGDTPTTRPGDGSRAIYKPRNDAGDNGRHAAAQPPQQAQAAQQQQQSAAAQQKPEPQASTSTPAAPASAARRLTAAAVAPPAPAAAVARRRGGRCRRRHCAACR